MGELSDVDGVVKEFFARAKDGDTIMWANDVVAPGTLYEWFAIGGNDCDRSEIAEVCAKGVVTIKRLCHLGLEHVELSLVKLHVVNWLSQADLDERRRRQ